MITPETGVKFENVAGIDEDRLWPEDLPQPKPCQTFEDSSSMLRL